MYICIYVYIYISLYFYTILFQAIVYMRYSVPGLPSLRKEAACKNPTFDWKTLGVTAENEPKTPM